MNWKKTEDEKPLEGMPVLGYFDDGFWRCTYEESYALGMQWYVSVPDERETTGDIDGYVTVAPSHWCYIKPPLGEPPEWENVP